MINFQYENPAKIIFGKGVIAKVGEEAKRYGAVKVLLVAGGGSIKRNGVYAQVVESLGKAGIDYCELWGIQPNPLLDKVEEGARICRSQGINFVLAVGGGSVIDTAKAIGVAASNEGNVWDYYMGIRSTIDHCLPIGVVLTIPAAGSETSYASVITNSDGNFKRGIHDNIIIPKFAIMDPQTTYSLSQYQMVCGLSDILAHLMERYFTNVEGTELTDRMIEAVCVTVINNALKALKNPTDYDTRAEIMLAATFAHNNSLDCGRIGDWGSHNVEHELSGSYNIAHGAGLSIIFPAWMKYVWKTNPARFVNFGKNVWGNTSDTNDTEICVEQTIHRLEDWYKQLGLPTRLSDIGIDDSQFETMANRALKNRESGIGQFVKLKKDDIISIFKLAL